MNLELRVWDGISNKYKTIGTALEEEEIYFSMKDEYKIEILEDYIKIEQYTGLKDIKGKKIFKGDIVETEGMHIGIEDFKGVVTFRDGSFFIENFEKNDAKSIFDECSTIKIVGNENIRNLNKIVGRNI